MRAMLLGLLAAGCHAGSQEAPDAATDATVVPDTSTDRLKAIAEEVDGARLTQLVKEMSTERYSDAGRQQFRDAWTQYMTGLGLEIHPLDYPATGQPRAGTDLEAVLVGPSADSVVVIVHYDSIGPPGSETQNPGADDDMSGMAIELETARILVAHRAELAHTVRFVASDAEELGGLAGARAYARYIHAAAQSGGFALLAAVDDEQSGWNCQASAECTDNVWPAFDVYSCGSGGGKSYDYQALGDSYAAIATTYSPLHVVRGCIGAQSDHFAMWEIGVPTLVFGEHDAFSNPHFDQNGGDTVDKIDGDYLTSIARPAITFQATLAGIVK